jgi:hypothetical protein
LKICPAVLLLLKCEASLIVWWSFLMMVELIFLSFGILGDGVEFFAAEVGTNGDAAGVAVLLAAWFGSIGDEGGTTLEAGTSIVA